MESQNDQMIDYDDILKQSKKVQHSVPEGYFDTLEERIHAVIKPESNSRSAFALLKPAFVLACTFAAIFGIGYGALSLTSTLDRSSETTTGSSLQINNISASLQHFIYLEQQLEEEQEDITDETILEYLGGSNSGRSSMYYYALASIE